MTRSILGRGMSFPPQVGTDGRVLWSQGEANVVESIRIILSTEPGERMRLPRFGAGLQQFLFAPNTPATWQRMRERVEKALARWEPRIDVEEVEIGPAPDDEQSAVVTVRFRLVANQTRGRVRIAVRLAG